VKGLQDNNQAAREETSPKVSKRLHLFCPVAKII
jgi:hypothetical protein